tara:strand:+ start:231 stop:449 length:219 start_codon:yes stop_codon:yes gene_type:complete
MVLKGLIDRIKISFCCKSKCSLNEVIEEINEGQEWVDTLEEDLKAIEAVVNGREQSAQSPLIARKEEPKKNI